MSEQRTVLPADFIEQRTAFANWLGKETAPLDSKTIQVALMSATIDNLLLVKRLGELQAQVDRLEQQVAAVQLATIEIAQALAGRPVRPQ
jgi:hypothetical protein